MPSGRRLIRRRPLIERIKAYLDPLDFLLWLSEELETSDWDEWQKSWAIPIGIGLNLVMVVARSNASGNSGGHDDVFGDGSSNISILSWFATFIVHCLSILSLANAAYTFYRKRHYRLFEASIDESPSTPSVRRVKVESSPMSSSPLRFLTSLVADNLAASRTHPDPRKDVWELSVWDPTPLCLQMFCLFSPGHVVVYWLFLPTEASDARPSVTLFKTLALASLLSVQLYILQSNFSQQSKDTSLVSKEVLHEYDTKFVHPRTHAKMRDVSTQFSGHRDPSDGVQEFHPVTVVNKGFHTNPNPNYMGHIDPDASINRDLPKARETPSRPVHSNLGAYQTPRNLRDFSSPVGPRTALRPAGYRASTGSGDGGSLGVYSHSQSPLKKSASTNFAQNQRVARVQQSTMRRESGKF